MTTVAGALDPVELLRDVVAYCGVHREGAAGHPLWSRVFAAIGRGPAAGAGAGGDDVDALVEKLDARCAETGERWDVYRLHRDIGGWRAHAWDEHGSSAADPAAVDARGATIREALAGLLATPRLPVVPRQPPAGAGLLTVRKDGTAWDVLENGQRIGWKRTKREAVAVLEPYREAVRARYEEWVATWGPVVEAGVEGVDFYWKP